MCIRDSRKDRHGLEENWADETICRRRRSSLASFVFEHREMEGGNMANEETIIQLKGMGKEFKTANGPVVALNLSLIHIFCFFFRSLCAEICCFRVLEEAEWQLFCR